MFRLVDHYVTMRPLFTFLLLCLFAKLAAQDKKPEDFGFRHFKTMFQGDSVHILVKSKKGDELIPKPLLVYVQGSLPQPLIKYDQQGMYGVFAFQPDSLLEVYHLVIIGKPYIPVVAHSKTLSDDFSYRDANGRVPLAYNRRNHLAYYTNRNLHVIRYLRRQKWVNPKRLVLAGHSEGSTIVAKMASISSDVTHLIYSGGSPLGRINSIVQQARRYETDSTAALADEQFQYWQHVVLTPELVSPEGDSHKATYSFSIPPIRYLLKLSIPILVTFGTKDYSAPFNDYLHTEVITRQKKNFTFIGYRGTEHNYFPVKLDGNVDYTIYNWNRVGYDWLQWLQKH